MRVGFYEDRHASGLTPIALVRPVFELVCGQFSLRERVLRRFDVHEWGVFVRSHLADVYRQGQPEARINDGVWLQQQPTLLINGRWLPTLEAMAAIDPAAAGYIGDTLVYLTVDAMEAPLLGDLPWDDSLEQLARLRVPVETTGVVVRHPWDLVNHNAAQLAEDFRLRRYGLPAIDPEAQVAVLGSLDDVYVDPAAQIDPFVVLDARGGPVSIDAGARVGSFTHLEGPCHVGSQAQLFRAFIREGTTVGPVCRVGGEVEASILHSHVNKYHTGFLGHSYVCPWVNLGALTTNSDLKNDYSAVGVPLAGDPIDTGMTKVGCYIGDHTKTGLGSLFNTGSSIGVMCMILPDGRLLPKHIPSFTSMWHGRLSDEWSFERSLESARVSMERRNQELTPADERLLRRVFDDTAAERAAAIERYRARDQQRELFAK